MYAPMPFSTKLAPKRFYVSISGRVPTLRLIISRVLCARASNGFHCFQNLRLRMRFPGRQKGFFRRCLLQDSADFSWNCRENGESGPQDSVDVLPQLTQLFFL